MKCPTCGYTQQIQYEHCLACDAPMRGAKSAQRAELGAENGSPIRMRRGSARSQDIDDFENNDDDYDAPVEAYRPARRSTRLKKPGPPPVLVVSLVIIGLIGLAAFTFLVLMKVPDDARLQQRGEHELANAQYAFAVQTLTQASVLRPKDPKLMLELARAYVGIDQVDKAWDCVKRAQSLGAGVITEPTLASDLANYYRRRGKYTKAIDLLRPLAQAGVPGKKAELADLDAAWGDDLLSEGKVEQSLKCWEEVRNLREGSRYAEAEARLSTIYQKLANTLSSNKDDDAALAYLTKLNNIAQNARNYEMAADIYERQGKLDLAIEQLRKASNMAGKNSSVNQKLGSLLSRRGKELLDEGNADAGYGYLQQAKDLNPENSVPVVTLRSVAISYDSDHQPRITGEVWNPTDKAISSLEFKVELFSNADSKSLFQKDQKLVDAFTPPLAAHESRSFDVSAPIRVAADGQTELRTYLDGELYKAYPLGKKDSSSSKQTARKIDKSTKAPESSDSKANNTPSPTATYSPADSTPHATPAAPSQPSSSKGSAEEKTLKDLDM
jgi:tetratricopeptide (TPR) repeat protein